MKTLTITILSGAILWSSAALAAAPQDSVKQPQLSYSSWTLPVLPLPIQVPYKHQKTIKKDSLKPRAWNWDEGHWQGIGINYSSLIGGIGSMHTPVDAPWMSQSIKSIGVDINLIDVVLVSSGCFGIISGIGLEINNFRFDQNVGITRDENGYTVPDWSYRDQGVALSKSKLTTTYLQIPLLFEFKFSKRNNGWANIGVVGGFLLVGHTKVKSSEYGIQKQYSGLNLNQFHYGFEAAIGYSIFALRAKYYPQSIFKPEYGPHVEQFNIGLAIAF